MGCSVRSPDGSSPRAPPQFQAICQCPEHAELNGITLPPSDPFWDEYYPPNGWNCRCTVVQVLKNKYPKTDRAEAYARGQKALVKDAKGMFRFNSGKQEKAFPDYNPYTLSKCNSCTRKLDLAKGLSDNELCQWCIRCRKIAHEVGSRYSENEAKYQVLKDDSNYINVSFDKETGGLGAEHIMHNRSGSGYSYELSVLTAGSKAGHSVILGPEPNDKYKVRSTEGSWDGFKFEVSGKLTFSKSAVRNGLKHCASKKTTEYAVLYFPNGGFNLPEFKEGLSMFNGLAPQNDGQWLRFKKIICIQEEEIVLEWDV